MDIINTNFMHIVGRNAKPEEFRYISNLMAINKIREDDAMLLVMVINYAERIASEEAINKQNESIKETLSKAENSYKRVIEKAKDTAELTANSTIESVAYEVLSDIKKESSKAIATSAKKAIETENQWSLFAVIVGLIVVYSVGMFNGYVYSLDKYPFWMNSESIATKIFKTLVNAPAFAVVFLYAGFAIARSQLIENETNYYKLLGALASFLTGVFFIVSATK